MRLRPKNAAAIKESLADIAPAVARLLLGPENLAMSSRSELRFGRKGSLSLVIHGDKTGQWYDHEAGQGGDLLALIQRERGCGFADATAFALRYVGGHRIAAQAPPTGRSIVAVLSSEQPCAERRNELALDLWRKSVPLNGTTAERYLIARGIKNLPQNIHGVLRFHPAGIFGPERRPMLVGLYRDVVTNEPCGVHRTALTSTGEKIGRKCLGRKRGAAVKLTVNEDVEQGLTIGEGIETTLSAVALGLAPAWAVGDAGELARFPVLPGIDALTILIDHDENGCGQSQAAKCRDRWLAADREVLTVIPDRVGEDINDLLGGRK